MPFCLKDKQTVANGFTAVENRFIISYLPEAPDSVVKVYLLGLALCNEEGSDNTAEAMGKRLGMTAEDVLAAYEYWEEMGLVQIVPTVPPQVVYLPLSGNAAQQKKVKSGKYARFGREIQAVLTGRMISANEFNAYYDFLESTTFEWEALVAVAKYCADYKGNDINYPYILAVANAQLKKGATTAETVTANLNSQSKYDADLQMLFKALKISRKPDYSDRELYEKWTGNYGFTADVLVKVAKKCKTGGMRKLDGLLSEFYKSGALDEKEIAAYAENKEARLAAAKEITRSLGVYYQFLDPVADEYVNKWMGYGFDAETLNKLAKYCFRNSIRTVAGMDVAVEKFYKLGLVSEQAIDQYVMQLVETDKKIRVVLDAAGLSRNVTASDRKLYKVWSENWAMPDELIKFAAENSVGANNPMQYLNKILSTYKQKGVNTAEQAAALSVAATAAAPEKRTQKLEQHTYTDEELSALFTDLENLEI